MTYTIIFAGIAAWLGGFCTAMVVVDVMSQHKAMKKDVERKGPPVRTRMWEGRSEMEIWGRDEPH